ncbi:MAG: hypothetical protein HGA85_00815, partial [Nanoarchaeota archaeon]|nr:hypothetical protein [Nanoarchaeota archaeon]
MDLFKAAIGNPDEIHRARSLEHLLAVSPRFAKIYNSPPKHEEQPSSNDPMHFDRKNIMNPDFPLLAFIANYPESAAVICYNPKLRAELIDWQLMGLNAVEPAKKELIALLSAPENARIMWPDNDSPVSYELLQRPVKGGPYAPDIVGWVSSFPDRLELVYKAKTPGQSGEKYHLMTAYFEQRLAGKLSKENVPAIVALARKYDGRGETGVDFYESMFVHTPFDKLAGRHTWTDLRSVSEIPVSNIILAGTDLVKLSSDGNLKRMLEAEKTERTELGLRYLAQQAQAVIKYGEGRIDPSLSSLILKSPDTQSFFVQYLYDTKPRKANIGLFDFGSHGNSNESLFLHMLVDGLSKEFDTPTLIKLVEGTPMGTRYAEEQAYLDAESKLSDVVNWITTLLDVNRDAYTNALYLVGDSRFPNITLVADKYGKILDELKKELFEDNLDRSHKEIAEFFSHEKKLQYLAKLFETWEEDSSLVAPPVALGKERNLTAADIKILSRTSLRDSVACTQRKSSIVQQVDYLDDALEKTLNQRDSHKKEIDERLTAGYQRLDSVPGFFYLLENNALTLWGLPSAQTGKVDAKIVAQKGSYPEQTQKRITTASWRSLDFAKVVGRANGLMGEGAPTEINLTDSSPEPYEVRMSKEGIGHLVHIVCDADYMVPPGSLYAAVSDATMDFRLRESKLAYGLIGEKQGTAKFTELYGVTSQTHRIDLFLAVADEALPQKIVKQPVQVKTNVIALPSTMS